MITIHTFSEREIREIQLAMLYAKSFRHGTDGHNRLLLLARLADIIGIELDAENGAIVLPDNVLALDADGEPIDPNGETS